MAWHREIMSVIDRIMGDISSSMTLYNNALWVQKGGGGRMFAHGAAPLPACANAASISLAMAKMKTGENKQNINGGGSGMGHGNMYKAWRL